MRARSFHFLAAVIAATIITVLFVGGTSAASTSGHAAGSNIRSDDLSSSSSTVSSSSPTSPQLQMQTEMQMQMQQRSLTTYALYEIPSMQLTFTSKAGQDFIVVEDDNASGEAGVGIEGIGTGDGSSNNPSEGTAGSSSSSPTRLSSLHYPIRTITQTVLLEYFDQRIEQMLNDEPTNTTGTSKQLYNHLVAMDITIESMDVISLEQKRQRHLQSQQQQPHNQQQQQRRLNDDVTITTLMSASLAFVQPNQLSTKPSNDEVYQLFGDWMTDYFTTPSTEQAYWRALTKASNKVLQEIVDLDVVVDPVSNDNGQAKDSNAGGLSRAAERALIIVLVILLCITLAILILNRYIRSRNFKLATFYEEHMDDGVSSHMDVDMDLDMEYGEPTQASRSWTMSWQQQVSGGDPFREPRPAYNNPGPLRDLSKPSLHRAGSLDAVRHGQFANYASSNQEALSVLEASDRYLSKHRPEWLNNASGTPTGSAQRGGGIMSPRNGAPHTMTRHPYHDSPESSAFSFYGPGQAKPGQPQTLESHSFGGMMARTYNVLPSNPFQYIYQNFSTMSGSSSHHKSTSGTPTAGGDPLPPVSGHVQMPRRRSSTMGENIAALKLGNDMDGLEGVEFHTETSTPRSAMQMQQQREQSGAFGDNIWRNVSNMINTAKGYTQPPPGSKFHNEEENVYFNEDAPVYDTAGQNDVLEQLKDEEDSYNFAFSDFPRRDGTPCLMYNPQAVFRIGSSDDEDGKDGDLNDVDLEVRSPTAKANSHANKRKSENDAFLNMLSNHSMQSSFQAADDGSVVDRADSDICDVSLDHNKDWLDEDEDLHPTIKSVKSRTFFKEKLQRIMANRHRQYEKKAIVEKHQQNRNARREKFRLEQQKRALERHQAMENALESIEANTFSPLDSTQFMKGATNHRRVHSNASIASQNHRRSDSNASIRSQSRSLRHGDSNGSPTNGLSTPKRRDWSRVAGDEYGQSPHNAAALSGHASPAHGASARAHANANGPAASTTTKGMSPHGRDRLTSYGKSPKRKATRSPAPRSPMVQHIAQLDPEAAARSPLVQFSGGIFRPSPKPVYGGGNGNGGIPTMGMPISLKPRTSAAAIHAFHTEDESDIRRTESGRSVSPPGGIEGEDDVYRPASASPMAKNMTLLPKRRLDQQLTLDMPKLQMPMPGGAKTNKISPTSVVDEIMTPVRTTLRPSMTPSHKQTVTPSTNAQSTNAGASGKHRRVYSFDHELALQNARSFDTIDGKRRVAGAQSPHMHMQARNSPLRTRHRADSPKRGIGRTNSFNAPSSTRPRQRSGSVNSRPRTHRRKASGGSSSVQLSSQDDLMIHGIYAKTRFT